MADAEICYNGEVKQQLTSYNIFTDEMDDISLKVQTNFDKKRDLFGPWKIKTSVHKYRQISHF